jgi:hypothetical protein
MDEVSDVFVEAHAVREPVWRVGAHDVRETVWRVGAHAVRETVWRQSDNPCDISRKDVAHSVRSYKNTCLK